MGSLFPDDRYQVTLDDMIKAADREVAMRIRTYPDWIRRGKISEEFAAHQIASMEAIAAFLKERREVGQVVQAIARRKL